MSQVLVVATGPEECGMVVPPARELPSQQTPEVKVHKITRPNYKSHVLSAGNERHELLHGG